MTRRLLSLILLILVAHDTPATEPTTTYPEHLRIVTREQWGANPPVSKMKAHKPQFITIHHTGTRQKPDRTVEDKLRGLQKFSQAENKLASGKEKPAWPDVPYHFYVTDKGEIAEGRDSRFVGDTNTEYDPSGHILVVLEGNFEEEEPKPEQMKATGTLVKWLAEKHKVPAHKIKTHKDYADTACPGENLYSRMNELRTGIQNPAIRNEKGATNLIK